MFINCNIALTGRVPVPLYLHGQPHSTYYNIFISNIKIKDPKCAMLVEFCVHYETPGFFFK